MDSDLEKMYVDVVSSLDKISDQTIRNLVELKTIYPFSQQILEKLYEKKYYKYYIVSKTLADRKFTIEEKRKEILWQTYVDIYVNNLYNNTCKHMQNNVRFVKELEEKKCYVGVTDNIKCFSSIYQTINLLEYVFGLADFEIKENYFSVIAGFDSKDAAEYFVSQIVLVPELLMSESIYGNTHDKLIDGVLKGKYTKARKKMKKQSDLK